MESWWRQQDFVGSGYPTAFADVACAIGVARRTGSGYGGRPDRVTFVGHSLGGWAAAVVGLTPTAFMPAASACDPTAGSLRPDAVVLASGAVDELTTTRDGASYMETILGAKGRRSRTSGAAVDPFALVKRYPAGARSLPWLGAQQRARHLHPTGRGPRLSDGPRGSRLRESARRGPIGRPPLDSFLHGCPRCDPRLGWRELKVEHQTTLRPFDHAT